MAYSTKERKEAAYKAWVTIRAMRAEQYEPLKLSEISKGMKVKVVREGEVTQYGVIEKKLNGKSFKTSAGNFKIGEIFAK